VVEQIDLAGMGITLRLNSVSVVEVFQAMTMRFEIERKPFRWELVVFECRPPCAAAEAPFALAGTWRAV
jgi:hypothetical protein